MSRFRVSVSSRFEQLWRYNIVVVYELCSAEGERVEFSSQESMVAPVGSNLTAPPSDYDTSRTIKVESGEGERLNLLIYVIPNSLPVTDEIAKAKPFHLTVKVDADGENLLKQVFEINQWSGDNISLLNIGAKE